MLKCCYREEMGQRGGCHMLSKCLYTVQSYIGYWKCLWQFLNLPICPFFSLLFYYFFFWTLFILVPRNVGLASAPKKLELNKIRIVSQSCIHGADLTVHIVLR